MARSVLEKKKLGQSCRMAMLDRASASSETRNKHHCTMCLISFVHFIPSAVHLDVSLELAKSASHNGTYGILCLHVFHDHCGLVRGRGHRGPVQPRLYHIYVLYKDLTISISACILQRPLRIP